MSKAAQTFDLAAAATAVVEKAAIAAIDLVGRGDEKKADQAAVDAMRSALNALPIKGRIVIGEGERDEAPMLYIGEEVGTGDGPDIDIALDPLEGTTITAKAMPNALAVLAMARRGALLHAPDVYMEKIAVGPGYPDHILDIDAPAGEVAAKLAAARGVAVSDVTACVLDRPRHQEIIASLRAAGARVSLIGDGDVAGVIATTDPETGVDLYIGSGGAPEGVLAAAALQCVGGQMLGRLTFRNDDERGRATRVGIKDLNRIYTQDDMVSDDAVFAAAGVTHGSLVSGVKRTAASVETETLVMNTADKTVRRVRTRRPTEA